MLLPLKQSGIPEVTSIATAMKSAISVRAIRDDYNVTDGTS
jgi:hypothetical protein